MANDRIEFDGTVDDHGKLRIKNRQLFDEAVRRFAGKNVAILVKQVRSMRSNQQNKYYWKAVVEPVMEGFRDLGYDWGKEETHEFIKANFNYKEIVNQQTGEIFKVPMSTTRLNKTQFSEMIEKVSQFAAEFLNIEIKPAQ